MRPIVLHTVTCLFCLCAVLPADDQQPAADADASAEVLVYPVRNTPPDQIVNALQSLYGNESGLRISAAPSGKTLLLRVDPELKEDVLSLLENIDPPATRLAVQVALIHRLPDAEPTDVNSLSGPAEAVWNAVRGLEQRGQVSVSDRIQTTSLENQQTMVSFGQQRPVVTGVQVSSGRGTSTSTFLQENAGTILTFTGRSTPDGDITLEIQFEKSEIVEVPETPIQEGVPGFGKDTTTIRSTVSLRSGTATLLSAAGSDDKDQQDTCLVLTATVLRPGENAVASMFERAGRPDRGSAFGVRGRSFEFGARGGSSTRSANFADSLFDRYDQNHDGVLQPEEVPPSLNADSNVELNRDAFRQLVENRRTTSRGIPFGSRGATGGSSRDGFSSSSRGGFGRPPIRRSGLLGTLLRDDVSQSLGLSEEQRLQAEALASNDRPSTSALFSRMWNASAEEREQVAAQIAELRRKQEKETERQLAEILSTEEMARLKQLDLQYTGCSALLRDDVAAALNLTHEQKSRFQQLGVVWGNRARELGFPAAYEQRAELERERNEEYFAVLTDEQRQAWLEMVGEVVVDNGIPKN
jgi:Bacterial type II and III secretion system protein/Bacterial type II/III secretion system short domain